MNEEIEAQVRALATQIGIILEDSTTVALIWPKEDQLTPGERIDLLKRAAVDVTSIADAALTLIRSAQASAASE